MKTTKIPQYRIDCASSDNTPACYSVFCNDPKKVKRVAGQLRRYYTSVAIKTYCGTDNVTNTPEYVIDNTSY